LPFPGTETGYRLLFVGLMETDQKGVHVLLDALTHIKQHGNIELRVDLIGDGALRALASGRPVISTHCGGPEFMLDASNGMIVEPGQPIPLAGAITELLTNLHRYDPNRIASNAKKLYSQESVTATLTDLYVGLTGRKQ
jgi:glycosyltransferase involved in cell wall biosynthesis